MVPLLLSLTFFSTLSIGSSFVLPGYTNAISSYKISITSNCISQKNKIILNAIRWHTMIVEEMLIHFNVYFVGYSSIRMAFEFVKLKLNDEE